MTSASRRQPTASVRRLQVLVLLALLSPPVARDARAIEGPGGEIVAVQASDGTRLQVRVLKPLGLGPFPLAIVNHGSPASAAQRPGMAVPLFRLMSDWLLAQGYMVAIPLRRGYGETGGRWAENYGACDDPDYVRAGLAGADDILSVLQSFRSQSDVNGRRILLVGWSAGGWASLAAGSRTPDGVFAIVNFAAGRGGGQPQVGNCAPERLVEAAGRFGATSRLPTLWLYASNDPFFGPDLGRAMFDAYTRKGGLGRYQPLPAFKRDGHGVFPDPDGRALWQGSVEQFLAQQNPAKRAKPTDDAKPGAGKTPGIGWP